MGEGPFHAGVLGGGPSPFSSCAPPKTVCLGHYTGEGLGQSPGLKRGGMSLDQKGLLPLWVDASSHLCPALRTKSSSCRASPGTGLQLRLLCWGRCLSGCGGGGGAQLVSPEPPSTHSGSTSVLWNVLPLVGVLSFDPPIFCQNSLRGAWEVRAHAQYLVPGARASARLPECRPPPPRSRLRASAPSAARLARKAWACPFSPRGPPWCPGAAVAKCGGHPWRLLACGPSLLLCIRPHGAFSRGCVSPAFRDTIHIGSGPALIAHDLILTPLWREDPISE